MTCRMNGQRKQTIYYFKDRIITFIMYQYYEGNDWILKIIYFSRLIRFPQGSSLCYCLRKNDNTTKENSIISR